VADRPVGPGTPLESLVFRSKCLDFIGFFSAANVIKVIKRWVGGLRRLRHLDLYTKLSTETVGQGAW
jgi:hypothetical protein